VEEVRLGGFDDEIEAAKAYDQAALRLHDPVNTNFPPSDYDVEQARALSRACSEGLSPTEYVRRACLFVWRDGRFRCCRVPPVQVDLTRSQKWGDWKLLFYFVVLEDEGDPSVDPARLNVSALSYRAG